MTLPCPSVPDHRYWSGFDRWEHGSTGHRRIACQMSPYFDHAMDLESIRKCGVPATAGCSRP